LLDARNSKGAALSQLLDILKAEGRAIIEEFNLASKQGEGTPQEVADFRENAVQSFITRFYPQSFVVSKGKITDLDGAQSDSIDCLILNPAHPHLVDSKGKLRLIFADGCDAAIEVKPNLSRTDELQRGLEQCITVKNVLRSKTAIMLSKNKPAHIIEHSLHIPFFLFAMKTFDPEKLYLKITEYYRQKSTPLEQQVDGVCISNVGILKNIKHNELNFYGEQYPIGQNTGWYLEKWKEATPLGLLLTLEYTFPSFPEMADSIMKRVLRKISRTVVLRIGNSV
jgi:hypothetical protein